MPGPCENGYQHILLPDSGRRKWFTRFANASLSEGGGTTPL